MKIIQFLSLFLLCSSMIGIGMTRNFFFIGFLGWLGCVVLFAFFYLNRFKDRYHG